MKIKKKGRSYVFSLPLPGMVRGDVRVDIRDGVLRVEAEKTTRREHRRGGFEETYACVRRYFSVPGDAKTEKSRVGFKDGMLTITVPKGHLL